MIFFGWEHCAGAVCFCWREWSMHLAVQRGCWEWGHNEDWYDGRIESWGLGPVFLLSHAPWGRP